MKGRSEKVFMNVFLIFVSVTQYHAIFLILSKSQDHLSRHYGVLFPGHSYLCFSIMSIKTMRSYLHICSLLTKFSDL